MSNQSAFWQNELVEFRNEISGPKIIPAGAQETPVRVAARRFSGSGPKQRERSRRFGERYEGHAIREQIGWSDRAAPSAV